MASQHSTIPQALLVGLVFLLGGTIGARADTSVAELLAPAPTQPLGHYDLFGDTLNPAQAIARVRAAQLSPWDPDSYRRLGMVRITQNLIDDGREIFAHEEIGDPLGLHRVFGLRPAIYRLLPEVLRAIGDLDGEPTTNLELVLTKQLSIGSHVFPEGSVVRSGLDVEAGAVVPIGTRLDGNITCAVCHTSLDPDSGARRDGVPNGDVYVAFVLALTPNSAAAFARLDIDPFDPAYAGAGRTVIASDGALVTLPDPEKFERAFDDLILDVPPGQFESSPDRLNNTTQIPSLFTFGAGPYGMDGIFAVGPFGGLSAINNAVHTSEINLLAAAQTSPELLGIDPEVYLGITLQNAADPDLRLPAGAPVQPSVWLRQVAPDLARAELQDQVEAPLAGAYPLLRPSLFTLNGLVFSPETGTRDDASGRFLHAANAMAAFQNSLVPPPNRTLANKQALASGAVERGAAVFLDARCSDCHAPPFFADNRIHPLADVGGNPARARSHLALEPLLVPPALYTFDTRVPIPDDAEIIEVPTAEVAATPASLPFGLGPEGGYKTLPLRGLQFSAPYLHDGGVAIAADGGLGLPATLVAGVPADPAESLRALLDRDLRAAVIAANLSDPGLGNANLEGAGHEFWVDDEAGYSAAEQADLIRFLLALDDDPGRF